MASVTTVRASRPIVEAFVHYHRRLGVRPIHLFFDEPSDPAADALEGEEGVRVHRCDEAHWRSFAETVAGEPLGLVRRQSLNATRALRLAREEGQDWLAHIDHDELLYPEDGDLGAPLARAEPECDVIQARPFEAVIERLRCELPFRDLQLFRVLHGANLSSDPRVTRVLNRWLRSLQSAAVRAAGCGAVLFHGEYFRGYHSHKSITRTTSPRVAWINPHSAKPRPGEYLRVAPAGRLRVLHFEAGTFEGWVEKWARQVDGPAPPVRPNRARQRARFRDAYLAGDSSALEALYRRLYMIPEALRPGLARLGMLRRIHLPADGFRPSGASPALLEGTIGH